MAVYPTTSQKRTVVRCVEQWAGFTAGAAPSDVPHSPQNLLVEGWTVRQLPQTADGVSTDSPEPFVIVPCRPAMVIMAPAECEQRATAQVRDNPHGSIVAVAAMRPMVERLGHYA
jgi:hypothetical protein